MAYKSGNPVLSNKTFDGLKITSLTDVMTLEGTVKKTAILLLLVVAFGVIGWNNADAVLSLGMYAFFGLVFGGLAIALVITFNKHLAPQLSPVYAVVEGVILGVLSMMFNTMYESIVVQAVMLTLAVFLAMLIIYRSGLIKVTENFKLGIAAATFGILLYYIAAIVLGFFNIEMPLLHDSSPLSIAFSAFIVCIAALNLVVDFDFIETGVEKNSPKYMEWYGAFGLTVTIIWLYIEILRLLAKTRSR